MPFNPEIHHRQSIRLHGYDYSQNGAYFVTICVQDRKQLFGHIKNGEMQLNDAGKMVHQIWDEIPLFYPGNDNDAFVIMPNHIHGIIIVGAAPRGRPNHTGHPVHIIPPNHSGHPVNSGHPQGGAPTLSLPDIVHRFKTMTTKCYADGVKQQSWPPFPKRLWQRNYWEHIIRNENEYHRIAKYIIENPAKWQNDKLNNDSGNVVMEAKTEYGSETWMV